jgi:hypothetical protein
VRIPNATPERRNAAPARGKLTVPSPNALPATHAHHARGWPRLRESAVRTRIRPLQLRHRDRFAEFLDSPEASHDFLIQRLALFLCVEDVREHHGMIAARVAAQGIERTVRGHGARLPEKGTTPPMQTREQRRGSVPPTANRFSMTTPFAWSRHPERRKGWRTVCGFADRLRTGEPCGSPHTAARNRHAALHKSWA